MPLLRIIFLETLLLLWLSLAHGNHPGHVRAVSKPRGSVAGGATRRGLSTTRVKGERKLSMGRGGTQEAAEEQSGTNIVIIPIATEREPPRTNDFVELEEPDRDYAEQRKLDEPKLSKRSKLPKKQHQSRKSKGKLRGPRSGSSSIDSIDAYAPIISSGDEVMWAALPPGNSSAPEASSNDSEASSDPEASSDESMDDPSEGSADESRSPTTAPTERPANIQQEEQASAAYEFEPGMVTPPTALEVYRLQIATSAFYLGIFAEAYSGNPNTTFTNFVAKVDELIYSPDAIPPIEIEWNFEVSYAATSAVIPSSEENLELIYGDEETLNEYVDIYLHGGNDVWTHVSKVSFKDAPAEEDTEPTTSPEGEAGFPSTSVEASLLLEFNVGSAEEPSQEEYERLVNALSAFYTALLTQAYSDADETTLATVTASLTDVFFFDLPDSLTLQANLDFNVFFSEDTSSAPTSASILAIMQENSDELFRFFEEDVSWQEDDAWNEVTDVTVEQLFAP